jgi:hypothetical protein
MRTRTAIFSALLLIAASCGGSGGNPLNPTSPTDGGTTEPGPASTAAPGGSEPPVPINAGLATFDAYVFETSFASEGPEPGSRSSTSIVTELDRASDSRRVTTDVLQEGPDLDEPLTSSQEVLTVGNESCTFDGDAWTYGSGSAEEREIIDLAQGQLDIVITPASPVEIGRGAIAGIPAINYSFTPAGFGAGSGAVTDISLAEYWVSVDGNVLLKYDLVAESRDGPSDDPETMTFVVEIHMELIDTVGPGTIALPADCLATADV